MMMSTELLIKKSTKIHSVMEAKKIIGGENMTYGFSEVTKMPCHTYSLPATMCKTGTKLRSIPGSACSGCYACPNEDKSIKSGAGGFYSKDRVTIPMNHRLLNVLFNPRWTDAMIFLFSRYQWPLFRWHDSGDLQNDEHFENICKIADAVPNTKFWLPTQEWSIIERYWVKKGKIPLKQLHPNLIIRLSARMMNGPAPLFYARMMGVVTSRISTKNEDVDCPASNQGNNCGSCRKCFSNEVEQVTYHFHNGYEHFEKSDFMVNVRKTISELLDEGIDKHSIHKQVAEKYNIQEIVVRIAVRKVRLDLEKKLKVLGGGN